MVVSRLHMLLFGSFAGATTLLCLLSGCGDDKKYERVSYAPVAVRDSYVKVDVPDAQAGAPPGAAPTFTMSAPVQPEAVIELVGKFKPKEPGKIMYMSVDINANVRWKNQSAESKTTFVSSTDALPKEEKDGFWSYRVRMPAPKQPREYAIEILHFGDLVATGKLTVE